jgi:parallel beta-helix repeat protein
MYFISIQLIILTFICIIGNAAAGNICSLAPASSLIVNVKDSGAIGNGKVDDTVAIQAAINKASGTGGTVFIPSGTYMINAITGIKVKSGMTLRMEKGAVLWALPNAKDHYSIINIENSSNVNVIGGTLIGDRNEHLGNTGEWGMGITLRGAANVVIDGVTVTNNWGDGFYITGASRNVTFCSVIADNNRRQGMSVISVNGMIVKDSVFKNTGGTPPQSGIDIEPNKNDSVSNVQITNSQFLDNYGLGVLVTVPVAHNGYIKNIIIEGNIIQRNKLGGIGIYNTIGHEILNNAFDGNGDVQVILGKNANGNVVSGNLFFENTKVRDEGRNSVGNNKLY